MILTRATFALSPDGDNDINVGDNVTVGLGIASPNDSFLMYDNAVAVSFGDQSVTVNPDSFTKPTDQNPFLPPGADATFTVPTGAAGTVVNARVDSWDFRYWNNDANCVTVDGEGIVGLYVNRPPVPSDDAATTPVGDSVTVNVLANDDATWDSGVIETNDPTSDELARQDDLTEIPEPFRGSAVKIVTGPSNGNAVVEDDGQITYTPDEGYEGIDTIVYSLTDNDGATAMATLTVEVGEVPAGLEDDETVTAPTPPARVDTGV